MLLKFFLIILLIVSTSIFASESEYKTNTPPPIGNFSLPQSQQPGPFYSFGQNVIGKGDFQLFVNPLFNKFNHESSTIVTPSLLYGITNKDSVLLTVPVVSNNNQYQLNSRGVMNTNIQFEHEFYSFENTKHIDMSSIFFGVFTPTGSSSKYPNIGSDHPEFFLGTTYNETYLRWLWFASGGIIISPNYQSMNEDHQTIDGKTGNFITASLGGGYNFYSISDGMDLFGLLEITGNYLESDKNAGVVDSNSGGTIFYATPSLWFSTKRLIFQLGVSLPIDQHWNGFQNHFNYSLLANVGYTFYH
jgi:hypothetical protein